jgi:hypothetical protein
MTRSSIVIVAEMIWELLPDGSVDRQRRLTPVATALAICKGRDRPMFGCM